MAKTYQTLAPAAKLRGYTRVTSKLERIGYASPSAFNAAFREFAGMTPSEFRASIKPK